MACWVGLGWVRSWEVFFVSLSHTQRMRGLGGGRGVGSMCEMKKERERFSHRHPDDGFMTVYAIDEPM